MNVSCLLGKTLVSVIQTGVESIDFKTDGGEQYRMWHIQDCCESVTIEDVIGDLHDLVGSPLTMAEEVSNLEPPEGVESDGESCTWTFYRFATMKGYVTIRWYGESNGYYSEYVDFDMVFS